MKIYTKKDDGGILMHSDTYLGEDYKSPNLRHYKYLRKEVRNGHTYYIYDDSELKRAEAKANKANKIMRKGYYDNGTAYNGYYTNNNYLTQQKVTMSTSSSGFTRKNSKQDEQDKKNYNRADAYIKKHAKQKFKDIPRRIHARGIAAISRIIRFFRGD